MATNQTSNLFLLEDLEDARKTRELAESDRTALRAVANWVKTFVARPHKDLGRSGPVCPFVPVAMEHKTLWLATERSAGRSAKEIIHLINGYKRMLLAAQPIDGEIANYKSIVILFPDLPGAQAKDFFGDALQQSAVPSYVDDGLVMGPFYEGNDGTALYNPNFRPFTSPVPLLLMRRAVISDWKFFLDTKPGSAIGRVAMVSPQARLSPTNYGGCHGARGPTNSKRLSFCLVLPASGMPLARTSPWAPSSRLVGSVA